MSKYQMVDGKPVMVVEKKPVEELRQIVSGLVAGTFFVGCQVPKDLLQMSFMPLMLGALSIPEDVCLELMGPRPQELGMYVPDAAPECEEIPPEPQPVQAMGPLLEVDPNLTRDVNFGDITEDEYREHILHVEKENLKIKEKFDRENSEFKVQKKIWKKEVRRIKANHMKALESYLISETAKMDEFIKETKKAEEKAEEWEARKNELFSNWFLDVGEIGEWLSKAEPRSINGYPIFFSFMLIGKEDWARIRTAYDRELKARDQFDV